METPWPGTGDRSQKSGGVAMSRGVDAGGGGESSVRWLSLNGAACNLFANVGLGWLKGFNRLWLTGPR